MFRTRRFWIGSAVSLFFIALLLSKTNLREVGNVWSHADYRWMLVALVAYFTGVWVRSFRYRLILLSGVKLSIRQVFPILMIGFMANNVLPARTGEVVRAFALSERYRVSKAWALGTVATDRLFDGLALVGLLVVSGLLLGVNGIIRGLALATAPIFIGALAVFLAVLAFPDRSEALATRLTAFLPKRFHEKAEVLTRTFIAGLSSLRSPTAFVQVALASVAAWLLEASAFAMMGLALNMHASFGYYVMAVSAANLAMTAPSSQGGIGPYEFFAAQTILLTGASASAATAFALASHALLLLPPLLLGPVFLWRINISFSQVLHSSEPSPRVAAQVALSDEAIGNRQ